MHRIFVILFAAVSFAGFSGAAHAQQSPGQFQGPGFNNTGGFPLGIRNRFDFRQWGTTTNTPPLGVNAALNGRNTTIYSNVNPSNYLGSMGTGQTGQFGQQVGQFGQYGQNGAGLYGAYGQPGVTYGQQVGSAYGQFGQFGQYGAGNPYGQIGGVGGKPGATGFNQIGGGGQFGSRYGL